MWKIKYIEDNKINMMHFEFRNDKCELIIFEDHPALSVHEHNFDELVVVYSGTAVHVADDERYPLIRGDVFVVRGNHRHGFLETKNLFLANFLYSHDYFEYLKNEFSDLPGFKALFVNEPLYRKNQKFKSKLHLNSQQLNKVLQQIRSMKEEQKYELTGYNKSKERIFELLIINICRYYSKTNMPEQKTLLRISTAIDFMENNYFQQISIPFLARKTYMCESKFRHSFKKITGLSPIDFLIKLRIEKAMEFMAATPEINVTETAMKTGFWDSAYFSKKFKEIVGITPMSFLKKQRGIVEHIC